MLSSTVMPLNSSIFWKLRAMPKCGYPVGGHLGDVLALKDNPAPVGLVKTADAIEDAGLTRSIGADNGLDMALFHIKADA
jgi:hypothetical protein